MVGVPVGGDFPLPVTWVKPPPTHIAQSVWRDRIVSPGKEAQKRWHDGGLTLRCVVLVSDNFNIILVWDSFMA